MVTPAPNSIRDPASCRDKMGDVNPIRRLRSVPAGTLDLSTSLRNASLGDEASFGVFYDLSASLVYGVVLGVVKDPAIAEEVTQEVFLELWRLAPRFDSSKGSPKSWAATIAHRRAVDRVRSEQSRRTREDRDRQRTPAEYDVVSEEVEQQLEQEHVVDALAQLTETQREAVTLAYYGGYTYREVAVLLDVPEGTIKTRIRDGLIKLRDQFGVTS